jgi:two-component system, chemotaxis family, sensor kinase CheA
MKSSQYVALFLDEAQLLLEQAQVCLDKLPDSDAVYLLQQELFRILHTLKGMASTLVDFPFFGDFTRLSHGLESLLENTALESASFEVQHLLQEGISTLQTLEQNIAHPQLDLPVNLELLLSQLQTFEQPHPTLPSAPPASDKAPNHLDQQIAHAQRQGQGVFWLKIKLMSGCLMKSVRAMLVLHNLKTHSEFLSSQPDIQSLQSGDFGDDFQVLIATHKNAGALKDIAEGVSEIESVSVKPYPVTTPELPASAFELNEFESRIVEEAQKQAFHALWLRFEMTHPLPFLAERIAKAFRALEENGEIIKTVPDVTALETEQINQAFEILLVTVQDAKSIRKRLAAEEEIELSFQVKTRPFIHAKPPKAIVKASLQRLATSSPAHPPVETASHLMGALSVRVEHKHLSDLHRITTQMLLEHSINPESQTHHQMVEQLYGTQFALQFVSATQLFERYPRIVKELERALNKKIRCTLAGANTWIPRAMADPLSNVLLHLLRNAADHGLEASAVRHQRQKPEVGEITFAARFSDQQLIIEVQDDGAGIDTQKLKQRSISKGLLSLEQAAELSDTEALDLVFSPGLSTAQDTTEISGRGVGMDTVKNHIEQLHGQIYVKSEQQKGSCFQLVLPSVLSHKESIILRSNGRHYGIPTDLFASLSDSHTTPQSHAYFDLHSLSWKYPHHSAPSDASISEDSQAVFVRLHSPPCFLKATGFLGTEQVLQERLQVTCAPEEKPTALLIDTVGFLEDHTLVMGLNMEAIGALHLSENEA